MGEKANLNLGKRYWKIVLKGKSCTCTNTKSILGHALVVWSRVQYSFFLLLYFLQPFAPSLLFLFYFPFFLIFLFIHFRVIYYGFYTNFSTHVWVRCSEFLYPLSSFLEPYTLNCKAAGSLLRHHLHINAEVTVPPDICYPSSFSFIWYFLTPFIAKSFWYVTLRETEKATGHLGQRFRGGHYPRTRLSST